jgi:hypothetical protein
LKYKTKIKNFSIRSQQTSRDGREFQGEFASLMLAIGPVAAASPAIEKCSDPDRNGMEHTPETRITVRTAIVAGMRQKTHPPNASDPFKISRSTHWTNQTL